ncbi:hypothetical protein [Kocuria marina]|uniref:hypothetical protein n=1 Tax=Kocuria marina TaxID=223184 RepID=UPI003F271916
MTRSTRWSPAQILLRLWLPVLLVVLWWFGSRDSTSLYFPPLSEIMQVFVRDWFGPHFTADLLPSLG